MHDKDFNLHLNSILFSLKCNNACQNGGTCVENSCVCLPGFTDSNCSTIVDNCIQQPCQNGGTCTNGIGSYNCTCPPDVTDSNCGTITDGGTCTSGMIIYTCSCLPGFTDSICNANRQLCFSTLQEWGNLHKWNQFLHLHMLTWFH